MGCCGSSPQARKAALKSVGISERDFTDKGALHSAFKTFSSADESGDMKLDAREFGRAFALEDNPFLHRMFDAFDEGGEGTIDFAEFLIGISRFAVPPTSDAKSKFCFRLMDLDGGGTFTIRELLEVYRLEQKCIKIRRQLEQQKNAWVDKGKSSLDADLRVWRKLLDDLKKSRRRPEFDYEHFVQLRAVNPKVFYPADLVFTAFHIYAEPAAKVVRELRAAGVPKFQPRRRSRIFTSKHTPNVVKKVAIRVEGSFRQTKRVVKETSRRRRLKSMRRRSRDESVGGLRMPSVLESDDEGRDDGGGGAGGGGGGRLGGERRHVGGGGPQGERRGKVRQIGSDIKRKLRISSGHEDGGGGGGEKKRGLARGMNETFNKIFGRGGVQYMEKHGTPPLPPQQQQAGYGRQHSNGMYAPGSGGMGGSGGMVMIQTPIVNDNELRHGRPSNGVGGVVGVGFGAGEGWGAKQQLPPIEGSPHHPSRGGY